VILNSNDFILKKRRPLALSSHSQPCRIVTPPCCDPFLSDKRSASLSRGWSDPSVSAGPPILARIALDIIPIPLRISSVDFSHVAMELASFKSASYRSLSIVRSDLLDRITLYPGTWPHQKPRGFCEILSRPCFHDFPGKSMNKLAKYIRKSWRGG
jgi:hypothetical protein